jgi:7-cyano-7-deazaguanine synthase
MTDSSSASPQPDAGPAGPACAVLCSAGLDSAVLLAHQAQLTNDANDSTGAGTVVPVYVRVGLAWEGAERATLETLLASPAFARSAMSAVEPLVVLDLDMRDVYPATHWAVRGEAPAFDSPDEDVYLEGRNLVLLSKTAVFAARTGSNRILVGPLAGNPFPDARPEFFEAMARALSLGLNTTVAIEAPFLALHKSDVIRVGMELGVPFELTLSCMQPVSGTTIGAALHCGRCSKCRERQDAFAEAGVIDPAGAQATTNFQSPTSN